MSLQHEQHARGPTLYLVATPIGNLEDITLRALRVLKEVDLIACEDTRQTQKLLNHYAIEKRTVSYHEHNEARRAPELIHELQQGASVALVSDAGMPGISDPGYRLVTLAIRHRIAVIPVPGPAAFVAALVASGLPTDDFRFAGFLPRKSGARKDALAAIRQSPRTEIFYEAPHRLQHTLDDVIAELGPKRRVVIARELSKVHEEFLRGTAEELRDAIAARAELKGETTLLIGRIEEAHPTITSEGPDLAQRLAQIMSEQRLEERAALKVLARELGVSRSEAYRRLQRERK